MSGPRFRTLITVDDLVCNPSKTMLILISKKNSDKSWRMIADEISNERISITPSLARKVALGYCKSRKIDMALGIIEEEVIIPISEFNKLKRPKRKSKKSRIRSCFESSLETRQIVNMLCVKTGLSRTRLFREVINFYATNKIKEEFD